MIRHAWTVLCQRSAVDPVTNNITLDVVERAYVIDAPTPGPDMNVILPLSFRLVTLWYRDSPTTEQGKCRISLLGPKKEQLGGAALNALTVAAPRLRLITAIESLQYVGPGMYEFVVELQNGEQWPEVARVPLEIATGPLEGSQSPSPG